MQSMGKALTLLRVRACARSDRWSDAGYASMENANIFDLAKQAIQAETRSLSMFQRTPLV
jgi:hypothetical protein